MEWDEASSNTGRGARRQRDRWIGVYIGVLAVALSICAMGGGNAAKEANRKNIEATNTWAFFQAKNMRRHVLRLQADEYELLLAATPGLPDEVREQIRSRIASYQAQDKELTSNPANNEGLDELFHRGKALEAERDVAASRDPYFDFGQALLQIAIVLASVAIISGGSAILVASAILGLGGLAMTVNGFALLMDLSLDRIIPASAAFLL